MNKSDHIYMILDNVLVYNINLPPEYQGDGLNNHLNKFDEKNIEIVAGFNKNFLEHFLKISAGKSQQDIDDTLKKMEKISYMVGPIGNLNYLSSDQVDFILKKMNTLKLEEINEVKGFIIKRSKERLKSLLFEAIESSRFDKVFNFRCGGRCKLNG